MNNGSSFKLHKDFEKRIAEARRIREKYPDRSHVIVKKVEISEIPNINKKNKTIKLSSEKATFIYVDNVPPTGEIMSSVYEEEKDEDGFFYIITYSGETAFGASI